MRRITRPFPSWPVNWFISFSNKTAQWLTFKKCQNLYIIFLITTSSVIQKKAKTKSITNHQTTQNGLLIQLNITLIRLQAQGAAILQSVLSQHRAGCSRLYYATRTPQSKDVAIVKAGHRSVTCSALFHFTQDKILSWSGTVGPLDT